MTFTPRPLPTAAQELLGKLGAPPRLAAHLRLVHDTAIEIVEGLRERFPMLSFDGVAVSVGAATHDFGKVLHPAELTGPGSRHEVDGPKLLEQHGVPPELARFARTHGAWSRETLPLEDLLVSLADTVWKGQRLDTLEAHVVAKIAETTGNESWEVFDKLDGLLEEIATDGDVRLAWQKTG